MSTETTIDDATLESVQTEVTKLEGMLESLEEIVQENHLELMERLNDIAEGGTGFTTFES